MKLLFVRHGQSENNAIWADRQSREGRIADPSITEIGMQQMVYTAQFIDSYLFSELTENASGADRPTFDRVYLFCSLMERSIQSAEIIAQRLKLPLLGHLDIHENGGLYEHDPVTDEPIGISGMSKKEFKKKYPKLVLPEGMNVSGWWNRAYETREIREVRASRLIAELKNNYTAGNNCLIFVSHGGFYNTFLQCLLGINAADIWFELYNGAVTLIELTGEGGVNLIYNNRFDFLPAGLLT